MEKETVTELKIEATALIKAGDLNTAIKKLTQVFLLNHGDFDCLVNLSFLNNAVGDFNRGLTFSSLALKFQPNDADALTNYGIALQGLGKTKEAEVAFKKCLSHNPGDPRNLFNLGRLYVESDKSEEGIPHLIKALEVAPNTYEIHLYLGLAFFKSNNYRDALSSLSNALKIRANQDEARMLLSEVLFETREFSEALKEIDRVVASNSGSSVALRIKAKILRSLFRPEGGKIFIEKSLAIEPKSAESWCVLGIILYDLHQTDDALTCFERALKIRPHYPNARWNRALALLRDGRFDEGWIDYEFRKLIRVDPRSAHSNSTPFPCQLSDFAGKHVLVRHEQGFGDVIQFSRFIANLLQAARQVTFQVQPALLSLFNDQIPNLLITDSEEVTADSSIELLSLPLMLKLQINEIPTENLLIKLDSLKSEYFSKRLGQKIKPRIGLCWNGGEGSPHQLYRGIPLSKLKTALKIDADFYCLQKEIQQADVDAMAYGQKIYDFSETFSNFSDTAALISQLDLVISIDTSVAHLSASLGIPTFILLIYSPDFRWFLSRRDSPWYPSARLFRQHQPGNWGEALKELQLALNSFASSNSPRQ